MEDYIVRGIAAEGEVRAFAIHSNSMVEEARRRHDTSPVMTAALGRLLSAASMMGAMLKEEKALITLRTARATSRDLPHPRRWKVP